jgi:hypothetical protein
MLNNKKVKLVTMVKKLEKQKPIKASQDNGISQSFSTPLTVAGCIILLIISPWMYYLNGYNPDNKPETQVELDHFTSEVVQNLIHFITNNATQMIGQNPEYNRNISLFNERLHNNLEQEIGTNYQPYRSKDGSIEVIVTFWTLEIKPEYMITNDLNRYPQTLADNSNKLDLSVVGSYYDSTYPYSFRLDGDLYLTAKKYEGDETKTLSKIVHFDEILKLPNLFIEYKQAQFQNNAETAYSDLARMTQYMLTSLARLRAYNRKDSSSEYPHKNIISEGDVELALNLALLMEETLLFRAYDSGTVSAIDQYFYNAESSALSDNPTGRRLWGSAEITNYFEYNNRKLYLTNPEDRLLSNLITQYVNSGYIDPADLLGLYLVLDHASIPAVIGTPKDTFGILDAQYDTKYLMDPRTPNEPEDTTNLKYILNLPENNDHGFNFSNNRVDSWDYESIRFEIDQEPNYLVLDYDFIVLGLNDPRGWYSDAELRPSIIKSSSGNGNVIISGGRSRSRTQVIIPERPKEHDYRLEFNLELRGNFKLNVRTIGKSLVSNTIWLDDMIEFRLPVNIFVWFPSDPHISSVHFEQFNTGLPLPNNQGWAITSEATLVEYFEKRLWPYLKPIVALGFDETYSIIPIILAGKGFEFYLDGNRGFVEKAIFGKDVNTSNLIADVLMFQSSSLKRVLSANLENLYDRFNTFMAEYFLDYLDQYDEEFDLYNITDKPQFPHPSFVPWITELGYDANLHYDRETNICNITFLLDNGFFTLLISGFDEEIDNLTIVLKSHVDIPNIIKLTTTVTSEDLNKPGVFADGVLFNTYKFSTRAYPKPDIGPGDEILSKSNEDVLISRSRFGKMYLYESLRLKNLTLLNDRPEVDLEILTYFPESSRSLEDKGIEPTLSWFWPPYNLYDKQLEDEFNTRWFISYNLKNYMDDINDRLVESGYNGGMAIVFSYTIQDSDSEYNVTIFLPNSASISDFFTILEKHGQQLVLDLLSSNNYQLILSKYYEKASMYNPTMDSSAIDLESYTYSLDNEFLFKMDVSENILNEYNLQDSNKKNLLLLTSTNGAVLNMLENGGLEQNTPETISTSEQTIHQSYYCYSDSLGIFGEPNEVHVLIGTTWFFIS